jgi:hypothetical protein
MIVTLLKIISIFFQTTFVISSLIGLPGNIISIVFPAIWWLTGYLTIGQFLLILTIIVAGEILEQFFSIATGKKAGINNKSIIISFVTSIILSILMSPILFGIGAIIGAFLGAFLGTFLYEYMTTSDIAISINKGIASLKGRFLGSILKLAIGVSSVVISIIYLF